jgi:tetratricopeptide (TPR) repeat protein
LKNGIEMMKKKQQPVTAWCQDVNIPTYVPHAPDKNPMFLEKRVYQGSSGRVYPLPFYGRISEKKSDRTWRAIFLENAFLKVMILPEIGGRIHATTDKTNGYDIFYRQNVIKPALVGLAGPWASGGVEFNWPQHHRPATFMPVDFEIEKHADGSVTVWLSDHDPMARMKGMHGVCLHPDRSYLQLKVRAYNRTPMTQSFLWWANVATRVHEQYQSFFPPDVHYIADHAKRAMSDYPLCHGHYYGVDYAARAKDGVPAAEIPADFVPPHCRSKEAAKGLPSYAPNDLSWYANIPVPTSYMCMGSTEDFFGGYDHAKQAGLVHIANHYIAPGKKQWTWGNHEFGYAWDRNLTDTDGPYIELMAGVYTDNQPDFAFLQPGETKTWSQYWYPIRAIGPAQHANLDVALSLHADAKSARLGVSVTAVIPGAVVELMAKGKLIYSVTLELSPAKPLVESVKLPAGTQETDLRLSVRNADGLEIIAYQPKKQVKTPVPPPATEPPPPAEIASTDELYITGLHLEQYRHATRCPTLYWREALRRDPLDSRCNNALGLWHFRRGEFTQAETCFRTAVERLTRRNPNPYDGEPYYNLGLTLRHLGRDTEAYAALYKSAWNMAWQAAAYHALAELDAKKGEWGTALQHLDLALRLNTDNLRARSLKAIVLRRLNRATESETLINETLALDPLDWWARLLKGEALTCDTQTRLDLVLDHARAGLYPEALQLLSGATPESFSGTAPLVHYYAAWLYEQTGDVKSAARLRKLAVAASPDYCFPARLEEIAILKSAIAANPKDARAPYYLGNLFYDRRRHAEAIACWEQAVKGEPRNAVAWRNLGIGYFNILHAPKKARAAYDRAIAANPKDARLVYERDQLWKRLGEKPQKRIRELAKRLPLVKSRDDLSVEYCALLNQTGHHADALKIVATRQFQPWEGGEGMAMGQHVRTHLMLGRAALGKGAADTAQRHFAAALASPCNLGESKHLLSNQSDIHYWLGCAEYALGNRDSATFHWMAAATFKGDFQEMSVRAFSEMTYYSALSWEKLGEKAKAKKLLKDLLSYAKGLSKSKAKIDYFATSLPTMLLFDDDLQFRQETTALFLEAQARLGLGETAAAKKLLAEVLKRDPNHALASDLAGK